MSKDQKNEILVQNIFDKIGGSQNIKDVYHCATRMRISLINPEAADIKELKAITNVKGALWANGELQLIIGQEVSKITGLLKSKLTTSQLQHDKNTNFNVELRENPQNIAIWRRCVKAISAIFGPLIPFLVGVGLIMALQQLLLRAGIVHDPTVAGAVLGVDYNVFDYILNAISGTGFKLMGVIALWSTVRYLGGQVPTAIALGLIMVTPIIPESGIDLFTIGQWQISLKPFYSTILVFIVMGIIVAYSQKQMEKYFHPVANFILNPFFTLLIGGLLAFFIMGPIMGILENLLLNVFNWFMNLPFGLGTMIVGLTWQPLVVLGVHNILFFAAVTDLSTTGRPSLFLAAAFAAAWAQMGATIAVGLKSKKSIDKSAAFVAALPGIISGPTESCIYGVNLPKGLPFITGTLAGAIGGWLIGIFSVALDNLAGLGGIVGFLAYTNDLGLAIAIDLASLGLGILITYLLWQEEKTEKSLATKTTKIMARREFLNQEVDFSAKKLIQKIKKVSQKNIKNEEILNEIKNGRKNLIDSNQELNQKIDNFISDLEKGTINVNLKSEIIKELNQIKSERQQKIKAAYASLLNFLKELNQLNPNTKEHYKLSIKKANLEYSLNRLLSLQEEKSAKLFNKGHKLVKLQDDEKIVQGNLILEKSKQILEPTEKMNKIKLEIENITTKINESSLNLANETNKFYKNIEDQISEIENLMNVKLDYAKNEYYNDIHYLEIKENLIEAR